MNKNSSPLVTIMIPVYNREDLIEESLFAALRQNFEDFEVLVVDNKSTDRTYEILLTMEKLYSKLRVIQNDKNLGPVLNWKIGIENARGKYIKILWSDDLIDADFLKKTVPVLENDENIGFVYSKTKIQLENDSYEVYIWGDTGKYETIDFIKSQYIKFKNVPVSPGNALFRTNDIKNSLVIDLNNENNLDFKKYGAGNDLLLYLNIAKMYKYFYYINDSLATFRAHSGSFSISNNLNNYYLIAKAHFLTDTDTGLEDKTKNKFFTNLYFNRDLKYLTKNQVFKFDFVQILKEISIRVKNSFSEFRHKN